MMPSLHQYHLENYHHEYLISDYSLYFKDLTKLLCNYNLFSTLDLHDHPKLEVLDCRCNEFLEVINILGCSNALRIEFDHSQSLKNIFSDDYQVSMTLEQKMALGIFGTMGVLMPPVLLVMCKLAGFVGFFPEIFSLHVSWRSRSCMPAKIHASSDLKSKNNKIAHAEEKRLFNKLSREALPSKKAKIIEKLGDRYTLIKCLEYGCIYQSGAVLRKKVSAILFSPQYDEKNEESLKGKREEDDNEGPDQKKLKPN